MTTSSSHSPSAPTRTTAAIGIASVISFGAFVALIPGCAQSNSRNRLGEAVTIQAFQPASRVLSSEDTQRADDPPSLTSLDRSGWEQAVYSIPVDATHHRPTYRTNFPSGPSKLKRQRGEYPTTASALELDAGSTWSGDRFFEGILEPIHASLELVRMPFAMAIYQPWRRAWSPMGSYERVRNRGERPETMDDLRDVNIPRRMTPAYEEESIFTPGDPAREDDNSNRPPPTNEPTPTEPAPHQPTTAEPATGEGTQTPPALAAPTPAKPDGSSR